MAPKKIEWQIALNDAGVKRGVKGVDAEIAAMKKSFDSLNQIKAFSKGADDLKKLEKELESARVKAAQLAREAETGGKKQQNAYAKAAAQVDKLSSSVRLQTGQLAKQSGELKKVGVSTRDLAEEQAKAEKVLKSTTAELKAATTVQEFYAKTGKRSYQQITREIEEVNKGLADLKRAGKAGPEELARASEAARIKVDELEREVRDLNGGVTSSESAIKGFVTALAAVAAVRQTIKKISAGFKEVIDYANKQGKEETKLAAVIRATGGAAGLSADQIKAYAGELQGVTTFGDEATISAAAVLATFKKIKGDEFKDTLAVAQDLSAVLGTDLKSSVLQLGKSLEDPKNGLSALREAGVSFTDDEKERIKVLQESNRLQEAQGFILKAIKEQVGGTANALRVTYGGSVKAVSNAYGDLKEEAGFFITKNKDVVATVKDIEAEIVSLTVKLGSYREPIGDVISSTINFVANNKSLVGGLGLVGAGYGTATTGILLYNSALGASAVASLAAGAAAIKTAALVAAPYAVIAAGVVTTGVAIQKYYEMREAQEMAGEAARNAEKQEQKYQDRLIMASDAAGIPLKSYKEVQAAYSKGILAYDALTDTYSKGDGIVRASAEVHKDSAQATATFIKEVEDATIKSAEKFIESEKKTAEEAEKTYKKIKEQIYGIQQTIDSLGGLGGDGVQGLKKINGEWQYFATNAEKAKSAMTGFNNTALVGTSQLADDLYDLSLAGRSDLDVWESRRRAAEQYLAVSKSLRGEAAQMYAAGDREGGDRKIAESIAMLNKSKAAYKSLSTEVKSEWTPAMEAAHKSASDGVKKYGKMAEEWLYDVEKHYDNARNAGEKLADKQVDLAAKLRDVGRAGMAPEAAYRDMAAQAREYEAAARAALAAGDFEKAVELAGKAESAWDSLGNEVKDGERTVISAQQALADQASGIQSSGQIAIDALKAQQAAEEKAGRAAEEKAKKATAAKEAEAKKIKALEEEKAKVAISAQAGAQAAAEGMINVNDELRETYEAQRDSLQDVADVLDDAYNFSGVEESAEGLKDKLGTVGEPLAESMSTAADSAVSDVDRIKDKIAEIEDKTVTITVKEVSASAYGSITGVGTAATGNIFMGRSWSNVKSGRINPGGPSMVDNIPVITAAGETITRASSAKKIGYNVWRPYNAGDPVGMAKALANNHPQVKDIFGGKVRAPSKIKMNGYVAQQPGNSQLPGNLVHITVNDYVDGVSYDKYMTGEAWSLEQAREARRSNIKKVLQR